MEERTQQHTLLFLHFILSSFGSCVLSISLQPNERKKEWSEKNHEWTVRLSCVFFICSFASFPFPFVLFITMERKRSEKNKGTKITSVKWMLFVLCSCSLVVPFIQWKRAKWNRTKRALCLPLFISFVLFPFDSG